MTTALRLFLALLGLAIGWSAIRHWIGVSELVDHYQKVGLGEAGRLVIALLQTAASVGLLVPRTQNLAALVFGSIMIAIATRNAFSEDLHKVLPPALLALSAALPSATLFMLERRKKRGRSGD